MTPALRPFRPVKPGELLQEELEARGWTQADLAEILGRPVQALNEIIVGKKGITPETALALARALGSSPEYWLSLEAAYRLDLLHERQNNGDEIARRAQLYTIAPIKELLKRRWIDVPNPRDVGRLEQEVCRFLDINAPEETPDVFFAARKTLRSDPHNPAQRAWACRVKQVATNLNVARFSLPKLEAAWKDLPRLSMTERNTRSVPDVLAELGVRFVLVEHLPHTRIDGATLWLDPQSPVAALSLRYDRMDAFWHTLMHELAHIRAGDGKETAVLDDALFGRDSEPADNQSDAEDQADTMAREGLIPQDTLARFIGHTRPYFSRKAILAFASELGVHPAIVVGQLQHRQDIPWTHHRNLLVKIQHVFA